MKVEIINILIINLSHFEAKKKILNFITTGFFKCDLRLVFSPRSKRSSFGFFIKTKMNPKILKSLQFRLPRVKVSGCFGRVKVCAYHKLLFNNIKNISKYPALELKSLYVCSKQQLLTSI